MFRTTLMLIALTPTLAHAATYRDAETLQTADGYEMTSGDLLTCQNELEEANLLVDELDEALGICDKELLYTQSLLSQEQDEHAVTLGKLNQYVEAYHDVRTAHNDAYEALDAAEAHLQAISTSHIATQPYYGSCFDLDDGQAVLYASYCDSPADILWGYPTSDKPAHLSWNESSTEIIILNTPYADVNASTVASMDFCPYTNAPVPACQDMTRAIDGTSTVVVRTDTGALFKVAYLGHTLEGTPLDGVRFMYKAL